MIRFITLGNDNPKILTFNLEQLARIYPDCEVILYDWGHQPRDLEGFKAVHPGLVIRPWQAHPGDYMLQKVACIRDAFARQADLPMVYMDADAILLDQIELFPAADWDIGATWRPDSGAMREVFGVGTWLNDGVVYINNQQPEASRIFLQAWLERVTTFQTYHFWIAQAELIRLFSEAKPDLSAGPNLDGVLALQDIAVRLHTLDGQVYNHLPEPYRPPYPALTAPPKVIHLKSAWRKVKFGMAPGWLRRAWLSWVLSDYTGRPLLKRINYEFNAILRFLLAKRKHRQAGSSPLAAKKQAERV